MSSGGARSSDGRSGGVVSRLAQKLGFGRGELSEVDPRNPDLVVLVRCDDDSLASSTVLDAAGVSADSPLVLRHVLALPAEHLESGAAAAELEGYLRVEPQTRDRLDNVVDEVLIVVRSQMIDARSVSAERSRMASLASRRGGRPIEWAVLGVPAQTSDR